MIYYIGDTHFGHANVIRHDNRPFETADEMDAVLIQNWNARVHRLDDVYILGDLCFRNKEPFLWYLKQLKGKKHLIIGNHDNRLIKDPEAMSMFESVDNLKIIHDKDRAITLCHYPMASWHNAHHGSWHIYAHIHNNINPVAQYMFGLEHALNAGCMINNYIPVTFDELVENNRQFKEKAIIDRPQ